MEIEAPELLEISHILQLAEIDIGFIYFLIKNNKVVYVGKSRENFGSRLSAHKEWFDFDSHAVLPIMRENIDEIEILYIEKYEPKYNKANNPKYSMNAANEKHKKLSKEEREQATKNAIELLNFAHTASNKV